MVQLPKEFLPGFFEWDDPRAMIPSPEIGKLLIPCLGGTGEKSMLIPGWSDSRGRS